MAHLDVNIDKHFLKRYEFFNHGGKMGPPFRQVTLVQWHNKTKAIRSYTVLQKRTDTFFTHEHFHNAHFHHHVSNMKLAIAVCRDFNDLQSVR